MPTVNDLPPSNNTQPDKILSDLKEFSLEAIPMLKRAIENMQANGQDKDVATAIIKTLPWLAEKTEKLQTLISDMTPAILNVSVVTTHDAAALDTAIAMYRHASDLAHNDSTINKATAIALADLYQDLTNTIPINNAQLMSCTEIEKLVLIKHGHSQQAKLL
ncbi:hypothetical protein ACXEH2_005017 [Klebsiella pneumoniae]